MLESHTQKLVFVELLLVFNGLDSVFFFKNVYLIYLDTSISTELEY